MFKDYLKCVLIFAKIGVSSFGGGYSMLPILQGELVSKRQWLSEDELTDYFALAQCQPGPLAINISVLISANRYGALGGLCGAVGMTLPSFIIILLLAMLMENFASIPIVVHALNGIKVVVAALVLYSTYTMAKAGIKNIATLIIFLVALVLLALDLINPIIIVVASAAAGLIIGLIKKKKKEHGA
ncbi:MAG: chromate transporter [Firmicutes bacterium]|nr:chromate transporter [Bacillota bacterium]